MIAEQMQIPELGRVNILMTASPVSSQNFSEQSQTLVGTQSGTATFNSTTPQSVDTELIEEADTAVCRARLACAP